MNAIKLSHGVIFITDGTYTVRYLPSGECGPSPVGYDTVEWDLRTESPFRWDYISESELRSLPDGGYERICECFAKIRGILGE